MNKVLALFKIINHSYIIRRMLKPVIVLKRKIEEIVFSHSKDAKYIRNFKNIHLGKRCFIIGNGSSLVPEDLELIKEEISFGCNRIYNMYSITSWRPTYYMCSDRQCLLDEIYNIKELKGSIKFLATFAKKYGRIPKNQLHYFLVSGPFEPREEKKIQKTVQEDVSMYFSATQTITCTEIEFAIYMGFKEIILLGVDHNYPIKIDKNGKRQIDDSIKSHFAGGGSKEKSLHYIYYDAATECYQTIENYASAHGIKIYNATRNTKLDVFEKKPLEKVLYE